MVDYGHDYENKISALYKIKKQSRMLFTMMNMIKTTENV